jgi:hypothetical protein
MKGTFGCTRDLPGREGWQVFRLLLCFCISMSVPARNQLREVKYLQPQWEAGKTNLCQLAKARKDGHWWRRTGQNSPIIIDRKTQLTAVSEKKLHNTTIAWRTSDKPSLQSHLDLSDFPLDIMKSWATR